MCQIFFCVLVIQLWPIHSTSFCGIYCILLEKTDNKNVDKYIISGAIKKKAWNRDRILRGSLF